MRIRGFMYLLPRVRLFLNEAALFLEQVVRLKVRLAHRLLSRNRSSIQYAMSRCEVTLDAFASLCTESYARVWFPCNTSTIICSEALSTVRKELLILSQPLAASFTSRFCAARSHQRL